MAKRMLIDATHPEETRVVVLSGHRLEEFDFESSTKKQVKGNIYLAKVARVEPSLQAAFVDFGGNRHGFLAFSEIHADYYRIPVSDRGPEAAELPESGPLPLAAAEEGAEEDGVPLEAALPEPVAVSPGEDEPVAAEPPPSEPEEAPAEAGFEPMAPLPPPDVAEVLAEEEPAADAADEDEEYARSAALESVPLAGDVAEAGVELAVPAGNGEAEEADAVDTLGGDEFEEAVRHRARTARHYKIQEVVKRRQIMLVQVTKEERGNKGAALTTYLSLAGRYCVLMPNTARGGGVSRKITNMADRRRLKEILEDLEIPDGMGVIVRTAGAERSKAEIKRDYEYLLRLWNEIRDLTLQSLAPALIYEEGNLIKRSIRDLYMRDIDEVLVEGEEGYRTAKAFMKMLMPSHAKRVQPYRDPSIGLFHRFQVESQIDAIHSPIVQLRSGGYIVISQTEALVAIDVNSGRATRERNIEETALRTNIEAADEIARQLRLRDLAGLIVIDFIDMEEQRNRTGVERRLKEALKSDRARIQVGRISPFGLLEMSRQRLRPSLVEASTQPCPHCAGTGFIRSTESTALYVLRSIEEEGIRRRSAEICVYVPTTVALYILNQKRDSLGQIEARYGIRVTIARDDALIPPAFRLERLRAYAAGEIAAPAPAPLTQMPPAEEEDEEEEAAEAAAGMAVAELPETARRAKPGEEERGRRRRRRRRRRPEEPGARVAALPEIVGAAEGTEGEARPASAKRRGAKEEAGDGEHRRRRRRGRRRPRREGGAEPEFTMPQPASDRVEIVAGAAEGGEIPEGQAAAAPPPWEAEAGGDDLETASLPALAGDEGTPSEATAPPPEPTAEEASAPVAEAEEGVPFASEAERAAMPEPVEAAAQRAEEAAVPPPPSQPVRVVTEKPAVPRRGWWQRLMEP